MCVCFCNYCYRFYFTKPAKLSKPAFRQVGLPTGSPTGSRRLAGFPLTCFGFVCFESFVTLSYYDLLGLHFVAADEAQDLHAHGGVHFHAAVTVEALAAEDAARHVDDLQGGFALVADDEFAVGEEGKGFAGF